MSASVLLVTDRSEFEAAWRAGLERSGTGVSSAPPDAFVDRVRAGATVVIDGSSSHYDEDELLTHASFAKASGASVIVALPTTTTVMSSLDDVLDDLSGGCIYRSSEIPSRILGAAARRARATQHARFEYLTVAPKGAALLAVLADGRAFLKHRPVAAGDDGGEVVGIEMASDAASATLTLESGAKFEVPAEAPPVAAATPSSAGALEAISLVEIDGPKLGARLRKLRLAANLTQAELAKRTGIHRPNIARVEAGRHTPSLETIARLAAAIGVPTTRVLENE